MTKSVRRRLSGQPCGRSSEGATLCDDSQYNYPVRKSGDGFGRTCIR